MEQVTQALWAALAAALTVLVPVALRLGSRALELLGERALAEVQARLGAGAARVAGEIMAEMQASPAIAAVTQQMLDDGAAKLIARFGQTVAKHGIPPETLAGMIAGELGKMGAAVIRR
jgi:hypothetical protein